MSPKNDQMHHLIGQWSASSRVLFPHEDRAILPDTNYYTWLEKLTHLMTQISSSWETVPKNKKFLAHSADIQLALDSIDLLNGLYEFSESKPLNYWVDPCIIESFIQRKLLPFTESQVVDNENLAYYLFHAQQWVESLSKILNLFIQNYDCKGKGRLHPKINTYFATPSAFQRAKLKLCDIVELAKIYDPFAIDRAFRYTEKGNFVPVHLSSIRNIEHFYGYHALRAFFDQYFTRFIAGENPVPLLMTSLPGLGKTHHTIANILAHNELTLILGTPEMMESPLPDLLQKLAQRPYRKFVLFIDDIDTRNIDWYTFRTYVGGSYTLPDNVTIAIASNYPFPPNVLNRGQNCLFPLFDPVRCAEMIHDFLCGMGMRNPPENLVTAIAADYTEAVGQKLYEDLSPRTLMRYMDAFRKDSDKRKRLLSTASASVSTRPDPDLFFESNIQRLRALYGERAIDELRSEIMKSYGLNA